MRKNNQPCLFFQRFGYCANQKKGTCSKLHDKKQISVCKKYIVIFIYEGRNSGVYNLTKIYLL